MRFASRRDRSLTLPPLGHASVRARMRELFGAWGARLDDTTLDAAVAGAMLANAARNASSNSSSLVSRRSGGGPTTMTISPLGGLAA